MFQGNELASSCFDLIIDWQKNVGVFTGQRSASSFGDIVFEDYEIWGKRFGHDSKKVLKYFVKSSN